MFVKSLLAAALVNILKPHCKKKNTCLSETKAITYTNKRFIQNVTCVSLIPEPAANRTTRWKPFIKKLRYHFLWKIERTHSKSKNIYYMYIYKSICLCLQNLNCSNSFLLEMSTRTKCRNLHITYPKIHMLWCWISDWVFFSSYCKDLRRFTWDQENCKQSVLDCLKFFYMQKTWFSSFSRSVTLVAPSASNMRSNSPRECIIPYSMLSRKSRKLQLAYSYLVTENE